MNENSVNSFSILDSLNTMASGFVSSIDENIYYALDDITFINSDILNDSFITNILGSSSTSGLLLICNSLLFGLILYYIVSLILSHIISFKLQTPTQFIFKLILITILVNSSYSLCNFILDLNSNISLGIRSIGEDLFNSPICFSALQDKINDLNYNTIFNIFSIQGFFKSFSSIGIVSLVLSYSMRYIIIKVFILLFPFAIISLLNQTTSYFFKNYIKSFISILFSQSIISLILLIIFSLDFNSNTLLNQIIFIGAIYLLSRVNYFVKELLGGVSAFAFSGVSSLNNLFKGGF